MVNKFYYMGILKLKKNIYIYYRHKSPACLRDVDIEKVLISNKISFGKKNYTYFIGTCIMIIKLSHYR